jgi:hypothetical protein
MFAYRWTMDFRRTSGCGGLTKSYPANPGIAFGTWEIKKENDLND